MPSSIRLFELFRGGIFTTTCLVHTGLCSVADVSLSAVGVDDRAVVTNESPIFATGTCKDGIPGGRNNISSDVTSSCPFLPGRPGQEKGTFLDQVLGQESPRLARMFGTTSVLDVAAGSSGGGSTSLFCVDYDSSSGDYG
jgi:hypothetical protein